MLTMLGIPNCDTIKKARKFLEQEQVPFFFRDVRKEPLEEREWRQLVADDHQNTLINTRSPSFRKTGYKAPDLNEETKLAVLLEQPTAMKRPAMVRDGHLLFTGFRPDSFLDEIGEKAS